jgi:ABC-type molybdate transport system substrate-binding protein
MMRQIVAAKGVTLVGPLPEPLQNTLLFAGGVLKSSMAPAAAQAFADYIVSPAARQRFQAAGFEAP